MPVIFVTKSKSRVTPFLRIFVILCIMVGVGCILLLKLLTEDFNSDLNGMPKSTWVENTSKEFPIQEYENVNEGTTDGTAFTKYENELKNQSLAKQ